MVSFPEIKASEKIFNEKRFNVDSLIKYSRISHTDNFILVDKNGKVYKSCLTRNPDGCPNPYLFYGYININHGISEEVVQLKKDGSYWCKTSIILSHLKKIIIGMSTIIDIVFGAIKMDGLKASRLKLY